MFETELLRRLCGTFGVSSFEGPVMRCWSDALTSYGYSIESDDSGNIFAFRTQPEGKKPLLYIGAHADEIGFTVTAVEENGFLRIAPQDPTTLDVQMFPGCPVTALHGTQQVNGVIGHLPFHGLSWNKPQTVHWEDLWMDIGAGTREESLRHIAIGDPVALQRQWTELTHGMIAGTALDNRSGCAVLAATAKELPALRGYDVVFGLHVEEEMEQRGAHAALKKWKPSLTVNVDVTFALDHPSLPAPDPAGIRLGAGPVLIEHSSLDATWRERLCSIARFASIPLQRLPKKNILNDSAIFAAAGATVDLALPLRSMHSGVETMALEDLQACTNLLVAFLHEVDEDNDFSKRIPLPQQ